MAVLHSIQREPGGVRPKIENNSIEPNVAQLLSSVSESDATRIGEGATQPRRANDAGVVIRNVRRTRVYRVPFRFPTSM
jgi:hypothetical protein